MSFCTVINCIDGRVQENVAQHLKAKFRVQHVDVVTETGPAGLLADEPDSLRAQALYRCVEISMRAHGSRALALVAHEDCAGNPKSDESQVRQLRVALSGLRRRFPRLEAVGLWVPLRGRIVEHHPR